MAEAPAGFDVRRYLLVGSVIVVVAFSTLFFFFRGCVPALGRKPGYTIVYSNLDLKDAANVIARLKELTIPYEIRDEGKAIAVPKDRADQARLGLAEKNLPAGGVVGWEIFDEARLGATDFDRRIQLIRAISGELSRTIRRIEGVEDVRVQIVIPETKLFAPTAAPVTASVMLKLAPGIELTPGKINGVVHLVASSVENLQPENVTIVDESGKILTALKLPAAPLSVFSPPAPPPAEVKVTVVSPEITAVTSEVVLKKVSPEARALTAEVTGVTTLTAEEKIQLKVAAKKDLEQELSGKAQELLNRFFPPNTVIVKVAVEIIPAKETEIKAKDFKIKKLKAVILLDNRVDLSPKLKQATFTTVAAAIDYDRKRGDTIILQKVPFHLATPPPEATVEKTKPRPAFQVSFFWWLAGAGLAVAAALLIIMRFSARRESALEEAPLRPAPSPLARERVSVLDQVRSAADRNPEGVAELLRKWLSE